MESSMRNGWIPEDYTSSQPQETKNISSMQTFITPADTGSFDPDLGKSGIITQVGQTAGGIPGDQLPDQVLDHQKP